MPTDTGRPDPPQPGDTVVDVSGTSYEFFRIPGVVEKWQDARARHGFTPAAGTYELLFWSGGSVRFTVASDGTVDYPAAASAYLAGRGTRTLSTSGLPVTTSASGTSYAKSYVPGTGGWRSTATPHPLRLLPGAHELRLLGGPVITFTVDAAGRFAQPATPASYLTGLGTPALAVHGRTATLDVRSTSYAGFRLVGTDEPWQSTATPRAYRLVPGPHDLMTQDTVQTRFTVDEDGFTDYATALDGVLDGRGTTGLVVTGVETTVDASAAEQNHVVVDGAGAWRPSADPAAFRLVPGTHSVRLNGGPAFAFTTDSQGRVDYAGALDSALSGRGDRTLTVLGPRVRWGFARVDAAGTPRDASGSWRQHPDKATSTREPTVEHPSTGEYRITLPHLAGRPGVTHVGSLDLGATGTTCAVARSAPTGRDVAIEVHCHHKTTGALTDNAFAVHHTGVRPGAAALDTRTGLRIGPITSRSTGPGTYEVVLGVPSAAGDLQITPHGPDRCQAGVTERTALDVRIAVRCATADATWTLSYADGAPLLPTAGAVVATTGPGFQVDAARSRNTAGGAMKAVWLGGGRYRVGIKGVGAITDTAMVAIDDPRPGHCTTEQWSSPDNSGSVWVYANCFDQDGNPAERHFRITTARAAGLAVPRDLAPLDPGPHPPSPKWGYYRVTSQLPVDPAATWPIRAEWGWTSYLAGLTYDQIQWAPDATVRRPDPHRYLIRVPGLATTALPHVQPVGDANVSCVLAGTAPSGPDLTLDVRCSSPRTHFFLWVAEPRPDDGPSAAVGPGVERASTGADVRVTHPAVGEYTVTVDDPAYDATGHPQLTVLSTEQTRCGVHAMTPGMSLRVRCTRAGRPVDSLWHLTYTQGTGPASPTTMVHTDGASITSHHDTFNRAPTVIPIGTSTYRIIAPSAVSGVTFPLFAVFATATESGMRCAPLGTNATTPEAHVHCVDEAGVHKRGAFSAVFVRRPLSSGG
ncbi:hypothetical protein GCM10023148_38680 [Actinokineospora soli]